VPGRIDLLVSDAALDPAWDRFLTTVPGAHHAQSSRWAQLKSSGTGGCFRIIMKRDSAIIGGVQVMLRHLPVVGWFGYAPKGPVLAEPDDRLADLLVDSLQRTVFDRHIRYLLVQPPEHSEPLTARMATHHFAPTPLTIQPAATVKIDLSAGEDELFSNMKKRTRREIRRGLAAGLVGREGSEADLPVFHRLLTATAERQGFTPFSLAYFEQLWRLLTPLGWVKLLLVERGDEPVSGQIVVPFSDTVITKNIGWSGTYSHLAPNRVLDWFSIKWAKAAGYRYYDLEGIDPALARMLLDGGGQVTPEQHGRSYYKLNYGGDIALLPGGYDYLPNRLFRGVEQRLLPHIGSSRLFDHLARRLRSQ
jgi:lipid II:glycine glycyltransferase (peptidoglycan interpeptide bridge formation enzyme)